MDIVLLKVTLIEAQRRCRGEIRIRVRVRVQPRVGAIRVLEEVTVGCKGRWRLVVGMSPWRRRTIKELLEREGGADSGNSGVMSENQGRRRRLRELWLWGRGMVALGLLVALGVLVRRLFKELQKEFSAVNRRRALASTAGHS